MSKYGQKTKNNHKKGIEYPELFNKNYYKKKNENVESFSLCQFATENKKTPPTIIFSLQMSFKNVFNECLTYCFIFS